MTVAPSPAVAEHTDETSPASWVSQIERARRSDAPVILSQHLRVSGADPWSWLDADRAADETFVAWHEPSAGLTFAALGTTVARVLVGPERMAEAAAWCSHVREHHVALDSETPPGPSMPLIVSSLAFRHREPGADPGPVGGLRRRPALGPARRHRVLRWPVLGDALRLPPPRRAGPRRRRPPRWSPDRALPPRQPPVATAALVAVDATAGERADWEARAGRAIAAVERDDTLSKIVLARADRSTAPPRATSSTRWPRRARCARGTPAARSSPSGGRAGASFVGATPELLVRVSRLAPPRPPRSPGPRPAASSPAADAALAAGLSAHAKDLDASTSWSCRPSWTRSRTSRWTPGPGLARPARTCARWPTSTTSRPPSPPR
jgi:isochorismate synthase EntC